MRAPSLKFFGSLCLFAQEDLCLVLADIAEGSVVVFKKGDPSFSSPLCRESFCAAETMLDSSCRRENPLLPRKGSCILPSAVRTLSGFYSEEDHIPSPQK